MKRTPVKKEEEPPKKKRRKRKPPKVLPKGETSKKPRRFVTKVVLDVDMASPQMTRLTLDKSRTRIEAGLIFISSFENISVDSLHTDPRFSRVSRVSFVRWSVEDKWHAQRRTMLSRIKEGLEKRLTSKLTESFYEEVQNCVTIRNMCLEQLTRLDPETGAQLLKAKSWEGVAKTLMAANERLDHIRTTLAGDVLNPPGMEKVATEHADNTHVPDYNPEELKAAAEYVLHKRRTELRERERERQAELTAGGSE